MTEKPAIDIELLKKAEIELRTMKKQKWCRGDLKIFAFHAISYLETIISRIEEKQ